MRRLTHIYRLQVGSDGKKNDEDTGKKEVL